MDQNILTDNEKKPKKPNPNQTKMTSPEFWGILVVWIQIPFITWASSVLLTKLLHFNVCLCVTFILWLTHTIGLKTSTRIHSPMLDGHYSHRDFPTGRVCNLKMTFTNEGNHLSKPVRSSREGYEEGAVFLTLSKNVILCSMVSSLLEWWTLFQNELVKTTYC